MSVVSKAQLRLFFESHDAAALFGSASPGDEELDEFLSGLSSEEIHECLNDEYGETISDEVPETNEPEPPSAEVSTDAGGGGD
jgi:hypothetical protein